MVFYIETLNFSCGGLDWFSLGLAGIITPNDAGEGFFLKGFTLVFTLHYLGFATGLNIGFTLVRALCRA